MARLRYSRIASPQIRIKEGEMMNKTIKTTLDYDYIIEEELELSIIKQKTEEK